MYSKFPARPSPLAAARPNIKYLPPYFSGIDVAADPNIVSDLDANMDARRATQKPHTRNTPPAITERGHNSRDDLTIPFETYQNGAVKEAKQRDRKMFITFKVQMTFAENIPRKREERGRGL
ncbi:hypothetical protein EVAR_58561_1 [Eumeta japonica]|uniref:Uncharacterized protein n=1 Tax=Eumeta variegata TaxID=151549 RepID=A0A4C1YG35_EUMVA|nr:hypothetical protein EVAR_58561_1 [Eumeta japonica]